MSDVELSMSIETGRGYSAYEIALQHGYVGTEAEWLASLHGNETTWNGVSHDANGDIKAYPANMPLGAGQNRTLADKLEEIEDDLEEAQGDIEGIEEGLALKLPSANVYNGLDKEEAGFALDARMGAALEEEISMKAAQSSVTDLQTLVSGKASGSTLSVVLTVGGWANGSQSATVSGVTANNTVLVAPAPSAFGLYTAAGIKCTAQGVDSLTFQCDTTPTAAIGVNVMILSGLN